MKKIILLFLMLLPFVTKAQVDSECYSATITYENDKISVKYKNKLSKSRISYEYKYIGTKPDSIKDDRNIIILVKYVKLRSRQFLLERYKDTVISVVFEESNYGGNVRKPIIYLYPQKETIVNLKVDFKGEIENTYPIYDNGWKVLAKPNGDLINQKDNSTHRYLFWDGKTTKQYKTSDFKTGFVVKGSQTVAFLDSILTKVGFNQFEKNDFISFWLPEMSKNEYNFVHFMINDKCDELAKLSISPKPDSEIRLYMFFAKTDKNYKVKQQKIYTNKRNGFVLVEWGGIELLDDFKAQ